MGHESSSPYPQEPATCPYPEPTPSSPHDPLQLPEDSHPHLRFLICKSILGCFVRFHNSLFVTWSGQKILKIFHKLFLMKTCSLAVTYFEFFQVSQP
jgi:hypothetical protein